MKAMSTLAVLFVLMLCYSGFSALAPAYPEGVATDPGKEAYESNCAECHGVRVAEIRATTKVEADKGSDLTGIGEKYQSGWIKMYVNQEANNNGKSHTKKFKGSDEELQALVDWLLEQKAEDDDE